MMMNKMMMMTLMMISMIFARRRGCVLQGFFEQFFEQPSADTKR